MRILLVEDDERMSRLVQRGLVEEGHQVDVCQRGGDDITHAPGARVVLELPDDVPRG